MREVALAPQPAAVVGQTRYGALPSAGSGCRRLIPGVALVGVPAALPRGGPVPVALPRVGPELELEPVLPDLPSSVRH